MLKKLLATLLCALPLAGLYADVKMPAIFTDHAVLSRSARTPVFGWADPGEAVSVSFGQASGKAIAGQDGNWRINLDLLNSAEGPFELNIQGKNQITVKDVVVGDVWLCSGQSNMQFTLRASEGGQEAIQACANPKLRMFRARLVSSVTPKKDLEGAWFVADPKEPKVGSFTGVGYFFGREIQARTGKNIGLIDNSWGGSGIEAWLTLPYLQEPKKLRDWSENTYNTYVNYKDNALKYSEALAKWATETGRPEPVDAVTPPANAAWKPVNRLEWTALEGNGIVWLRKKINITEKQAKEGFNYNVGQLAIEAAMFLDGQKIIANDHLSAIRGQNWFNGRVPAGKFAAGEHEITLRIWGINPKWRILRNTNSFNGVPNNKGWEMTVVAYPALTKEQEAARPVRPDPETDSNKVPELLYNGLIAPLKPYAITGTIWFQGCTNSGRPDVYAPAVQSMIREWRKDFENEFPFYYCQLANYMAKDNDPNKAGWALIRCGQDGALAMPKTGRACLIDVGESNDIHFLNKLTPGKRLAALALVNHYGFKDMACEGPVCTKVTPENGKIRATFDVHDFKPNLVAHELPATYDVAKVRKETRELVRNSPASQVEGFAIAGADGKFYWASGRIEGNSVLLWSAQVPSPVKVRYAYQNNPTCNLYNESGFPAVPFEK